MHLILGENWEREISMGLLVSSSSALTGKELWLVMACRFVSCSQLYIKDLDSRRNIFKSTKMIKMSTDRKRGCDRNGKA